MNKNNKISGLQLNPEHLVLRKIERTDNAQVEQMIVNVMSDYECIGEEYSSSDPELKDMYTSYNNPGSVFYVIEYKGNILGCGGLAPLEGGASDTCELRKMYFYQSLRGLGFGRKLMDICLNDARLFGYRIMYLETVERMEKANRLYAFYGFEPLEGQVGNTGHSGCDTFYRKEL
ncbi:MAG: GNAT family N-acetyltransferase [Saprospiraceae bacterium]|nr:GNAT family N-acetyltransferase [Saprospiraceae bacterium]